MLGDGFCVRNFGVNAHAAQRTADFPYWSSEAFGSSIAFKPDTVLIMLGTNDSRGDNWKGLSAFADDYRALVEHYRSLESNPAIWLLTPPALFRPGWSTKVRYSMDERAIREMCGAIADISRELGCGFIDINAATAEHPEAFRLDGVHPGAAGARVIARTVFEALSGSALLPR
jgi:lysophospholipase L1-like esterase